MNSSVSILPSRPKEPIAFGKYWLLDRISIGGMAEIWRAELYHPQPGLPRVVAIKRILPSVAEDPDCVAMFMDEAKISMQLHHPNIAQVFELGQVGSSHFIALEYVHGKDVRAIFDRCREIGAPATVAMTCYVIAKACEALDHAHRKRDASGEEMRIVHRDVSPQNLLISYEGEVKVIDFGIAKAAANASQSQAGILKGKFGYLSPERVAGLPFDRRSDVFGIGVCLHELLTGERLFASDEDEVVLEKIRTADVRPPSNRRPGIPEALDRIVLKALARDPENRYQYASELGRDLEGFLIESKSFFERKDLMQYMKSTFAEELEEASGAGAARESPEPPVLLLPKIEAAGPMLSNSTAGAIDRKPEPLEALGPRRTDADARRRDREQPSAPVPVARAETESRAGPSRLRLLGYALIGAVSTLAVGVLGLALFDENQSGVLLIELPPETAGRQLSITVGGEELRATGRGPVLHRMRAGASSLMVDADGYETYRERVDVKSGRQPTRVGVQLKPKTQLAQLAVIADPPSAEIQLDGKVVKAAGSSDFYVGAIPLGHNQLLVVRQPGFRTFEKRIAATAPDQHLQVKATLQPMEVALLVSSKPSGANILVSGRRLGRTPSEVQVLADVGELTLSKRCYEPLQIPVSLPADFAARDPKEPLRIDVSLKRVPGCR